MMVLSSLGSLFEKCVSAGRVYQVGFTHNAPGTDSVICRTGQRNRMSRNRYVVTRARLLSLALLAAMALSSAAFSTPSMSKPLRVADGEVSIAQVPPRMARLPHHRPAVAATPPHAQANPTLRKMAEDAATAHTLPVGYFLRLIRQESGFNPNSVSRAGAQGIAQFMPGTAFDRGLRDPFDPAEALPKSAELLHELRDHFGNLGLAAAAYNAGPERVHRWLAGKSPLPQETIDYVRVITGHEAVEWAKSNDLALTLNADATGPFSEVRLRIKRLSWESELLAALQANSANASGTAVATISPVKMGEASLCSRCIFQSAY
jgi:Transglycosylase SLT domain